jgi:hypothetical protein
MTREAPEEHPLMKTSNPAAAVFRKVRRFMISSGARERSSTSQLPGLQGVVSIYARQNPGHRLARVE